MENYKKELRQNRALKADEILKDFIDQYGLRKNLLTEITLLQNRTRGSLFELMGELTISNIYNIKNLQTQKIFNTPIGKRKVDLFSTTERLMIEIKSGYARSNAFTRKQIKKDAYLVRHNSDVDKCVWLLYRGATQPLKRYLEKYNIEYFDVEYDRIQNMNNDKSESIIIEV